MAKWALVFIITAGGQPATVTFPGYPSQTACAQAGADAVNQSTFRSEDKKRLGYFCVAGPERTPLP
jgi:hypothetical protein